MDQDLGISESPEVSTHHKICKHGIEGENSQRFCGLCGKLTFFESADETPHKI